MERFIPWCLRCLVVLCLGPDPGLSAAQVFRVGTYNIENYLLAPVGTRPAKTPESRAAVRRMIREMGVDVLALQEVGGRAALEELRAGLRSEGLDYPHADIAAGHDPYIQVALLSRFPLRPAQSLTNGSFLLYGRRHFMSRGFLEAEVEVAPSYRFTLLCAHLKSRRAVPEASEEELREQEALLLRERVDARLRADPKANVVVLGDLNDTRDSRAVRQLLGRGVSLLVDTRPAEGGPGVRRGPDMAGERSVNWTHFYAHEDSYSRIDYILLSRGMTHEWVREEGFVLARPDWGAASDHRPVVAVFRADDHGPRP